MMNSFQPTCPNDDPNLPSYTHPSYIENQQDLQLLFDVWNSLRGCKASYILKQELEPNQAYQNRLQRCAFDNRFKPAINAFASLLTNFKLSENAPSSIIDNENNIDLKGSSIQAFFQKSDTLALRDGFCFVLVEFPKLDNSLIKTNRDYLEVKKHRRPYLVNIDRRNVLNWNIDNINGVPTLTQVTLRETRLEPDGKFGVKEQTYYRILYPGYYEVLQIVATGNSGSGGEWQVVEVESGETNLDIIPLVYYASSNADLFQAEPLFLDLAEMNIEHYDKKSQLNDIIRKVNLPIPVRKAARNIQELEQLAKRGLTLGSNSALDLPIDGTFEFAEPSGSAISSSQEDISKLEASMDRFALSFISGDDQNPKTATQIRFESSQTQASLQSLAHNKRSSIEEIFSMWSKYTGEAEPEAFVELNDNLLAQSIPVESVDRLISLASQGFISSHTLLSTLHQGGFLPEDFDLEQELATTENKQKDSKLYDDTEVDASDSESDDVDNSGESD